MKEISPLLMNCPLFERLAPAALPQLLSCLNAQLVHVPKGGCILQQGDPARFEIGHAGRTAHIAAMFRTGHPGSLAAVAVGNSVATCQSCFAQMSIILNSGTSRADMILLSIYLRSGKLSVRRKTGAAMLDALAVNAYLMSEDPKRRILCP